MATIRLGVEGLESRELMTGILFLGDHYTSDEFDRAKMVPTLVAKIAAADG